MQKQQGRQTPSPISHISLSLLEHPLTQRGGPLDKHWGWFGWQGNAAGAAQLRIKGGHVRGTGGGNDAVLADVVVVVVGAAAACCRGAGQAMRRGVGHKAT